MAGTKAGSLKAKQTIYKKYGKDFYANIGRKGGANGRTGGFYGDPARARALGRIGGSRSKRKIASL